MSRFGFRSNGVNGTAVDQRHGRNRDGGDTGSHGGEGGQ
jgi:hypothetical protein